MTTTHAGLRPAVDQATPDVLKQLGQRADSLAADIARAAQLLPAGGGWRLQDAERDARLVAHHLRQMAREMTEDAPT